MFSLLVLSLGAVSADENTTVPGMSAAGLNENTIPADNHNNLDIDKDNELFFEDSADARDVSSSPNVRYVEGNTFKDIQDAIDSASENDTLILNGTYIGDGRNIVVNKTITITSENNNGIIDANKTTRCLYVSANNVVLKNISIINGLKGWYIALDLENRIEGEGILEGAGIYWAGNNGQMINCNVNNNSHNHGGFCVYWTGLNGSVINSSFYSNKHFDDSCGGSECSFLHGFIHGKYEGVLWGDCYFDNVAINAKSELTFNEIAGYNDEISFRAVSENNVPYINDTIEIHIYNNSHDFVFEVKTDSNGFATIKLPSNLTAGNYNIEFYAKMLEKKVYAGLPPNTILMDEYYSIELITNSSVNVVKSGAILKSSNLIKRFDSNRYFSVKLADNKNNPIKNSKIKINIYNKNKLLRTCYVTTNTQGIANLPLTLYAGNYKFQIFSLNSNYNTKAITKIVKVTKAPLVVKVQNIVKKNRSVKIQVLSGSKIPIENVLLKIKVFSGKTYKIYNAKTNFKGFAKINTKNLSIGNHKIQITTANPNWQISKKTTLKITK